MRNVADGWTGTGNRGVVVAATSRVGIVKALAMVCATATTIAVAGCAAPEGGIDESTDEVMPESSALKNGSLPDGTAKWRGVVKVSVYWPSFGGWSVCTGVITSQITMVTAAHCVTPAISAGSTGGHIQIAVTRETSPGVFQTLMTPSIAYAQYNPAYDGFAKHDVAVITAQTQWANITQQDAIPIAKAAPSGSTMWALGYGNYNSGVNDFDGQGRAGQVTPVYGSQEYTFSSAPTGTILCSGDSGGPIKMANGSWYIYGLLSLTTGGSGKCGSVAHWAPSADNFAWFKSTIGTAACLETLLGLFCW